MIKVWNIMVENKKFRKLNPNTGSKSVYSYQHGIKYLNFICGASEIFINNRAQESCIGSLRKAWKGKYADLGLYIRSYNGVLTTFIVVQIGT